MLGIAVGVLHVLLRAEQTGRDRVHQTRVLAQLARQFRVDAGEAIRVTPGDDAESPRWDFALGEDRNVTYRMTPAEVRRDEQAAGKLVRQESYPLPRGCSATIRTDDGPTGAMTNLIVTGDGPRWPADREMQVMALLGKDHRFAKLPIGSQ